MTRLYESPQGLFDFQAEGVAHCYMRVDNLAVWDTGIGKTHLAMATSALLFEDDLIDHVIIVCEKNKVREWGQDLDRFTKLSWALYHGSVAKREKIRDDLPPVLITTYETARNDAVEMVKVKGRRSKKLEVGPLSKVLGGKRVLVVYDEMTKLGNRSSQNHKAHEFLIKHLRSTWRHHPLFDGDGKPGECRVMGLTATPIERSPENFYNLGRILVPGGMGTVAAFDHEHVKARDIFGNVTHFKNLTRDTLEDSNITPFTEKVRPFVLRKRKTDPDVIDQFPQTVEEITYVELTPRHRDFYDTVQDIFDDGTEETRRILFGLMRQVAGHPLSLLSSEGQMAQQVVKEVGEEGLKALGSVKQDRLVEYLIPLVHGQGAQAVVFTFFGPSIIPLLQEALEEAGILCAINHGQMTDGDRARSMESFKAGEANVFLTSDAGSRGINLPEATYAIEYEMALTHANRTQRLNRIHRIDSKAPSVTFQSFVAQDTVEEAIARLVLKRNEWSDLLLDDDDVGDSFVTAKMRRELWKRAKAQV